MTLSYLLSPTFQFTNVSGKPLTDGYVNVYISGTRSKYYAFSDFDGSLHPFNIPLNALGSAVILVSPAHSYDIYVYNSVGTLQMSRYNITPATGEGTVITDVTTLNSKDGTVDIKANSSTDYDLSIATKIAELKEYTDHAKNDAIESANTSIADLDDKKKDKQTELNFNGSATKTVKSITQNANGELNVEFEDIDLPGYSISSSDGSINVSTSESVTDLTLPNDVVRDSAYTHIDAATANPLMDGTAAVGISTKYAREDHVHPSDTSKEDIANKTTVILGTSHDKYPTDKAVAEFVNSSIATNTANYISNNSNPFTSVEQLNAYTGTVTNNDYAFVNGIDSDGNTYYDRYKATVNGSSVTWSLEYRLNNSSFTAAQWSAINSGITSALVAKIHDHSNKAVLDGITSDNVSNWNNKMDNQTVGGASEPVYLENGIAKIATGVATKTDLNNLTEVVNGHTTEIGQIKDDVAGIESALSNKKDKQSANTFTGSATKTIKNISQNANGELTVEFEDIDLSKRVAVDIRQNFDDNEKKMARENIGLDSVGDNVKFSKVIGGIDMSDANLKIEMTKIINPDIIQFYTLNIKNENNNEEKFALVPLNEQGGFLYKMEEGPIVVKEIPSAGDVHYNLYKKYAVNITSNTFKKNVISLSEPAYNVRGWVSVMPENGGASIMPLKAGETDYINYTGNWDKVSNNINNSNLPRNSYTFIPFAWTTDYPIVAIGIKGNGEVSIGHAFVETIK